MKGTGAGKSMGSGDQKSMGSGALQQEVQEMKMNMDTLEKERDFYFAKLRDIEVLL